MTPVDDTSAGWHRLDVADAIDEKRASPLGLRIREARKARGLSTNKANELCGFAQGYLSRVERGERESPRGLTLEVIAAALNVYAAWLITGSGPRDSRFDLANEGLLPWAEVAGRIWMGRGKSRDDVLEALRAAAMSTGYRTLKPAGWVELAQQYWDGTLDPPAEPEKGLVQAMRAEAASFYSRRHGTPLERAKQVADRIELKDPTSLLIYGAMLDLTGDPPLEAKLERGDDFTERKPKRRRA